MSFELNEKQIASFKKLKAEFKKCQKLGLRFYGKSDNLVAYTKQADDYNDEVDFNQTLGTGFSEIPYLSSTGLIIDSGADDYPCFRSFEDKEKYS